VRIAKEIPNPQFVGNPELGANAANAMFRKNNTFFLSLAALSFFLRKKTAIWGE